MDNMLNEDINRMKTMMGLITEDINETSMEIPPYKIWASDKGNIWVQKTDTGKQYAYKIEVKYGVWVSITVHDFPNGTHMKLSAPVKGLMTVEVDKGRMKSSLSSNFGKSSFIDYVKDKDGETQTLRYTKLA